jgi:ABC-type amino acid transport substrate-binding protein
MRFQVRNQRLFGMKFTWSWLQFCFLASLCWYETWLQAEEAAVPLQNVVHFDMVFRKDTDPGQRLVQTFSRAFSQFGFRFSAEHYPARRGIEELKYKRVDGTLGRVDDLASVHGLKDYVRLEVPLLYTTLALWCNKDVRTMKSLMHPRVVYLRNSTLAHRLAKRIEDRSVQLSSVSSYHNMLVMLQRDRVDCILATDVQLDTERLRPEGFSASYRYNLVTLPVYSWISRKYENWKSSLENDLRQLVSTREWKKLYLEHKTSCTASFHDLCPDGRIFARQFPFKDNKRMPVGG